MRLRLLSSFFLVCLALSLGCNRAPQNSQDLLPPSASTSNTSALAKVPDTGPASTNATPTLEPATNLATAVVEQTNAPPLTPVEKGLRLQMKWPVGHRYVYRLELEQHSTNRLADLPRSREEDQALGLTYALTVSQSSPTAQTVLEIELLAFDIIVKIGGVPALSFDSAASSAQSDPITAPFKKVAPSKLRLELNAQGTVDHVIGLEDWVGRVVGDAQGPAEEMIRQQFNDGFFRQMADFGRAFPPAAVEVGDNWPFRAEVPVGALGKIEISAVISLLRTEDHEPHKLAVLEGKGTLKGIPPPDRGKAGDLMLKQGSTSTTTWLDPEQGAVIESMVEQSMRLSGDLPDSSGRAQPSAGFTSDIGQKITVKLVENTH